MKISMFNILIVDDDDELCDYLQTIIHKIGYHTTVFNLGNDLINYMKNEENIEFPAIALFDLALPDITGVELMHKVKEKSPQTEIIMMTGNPDMKSAIDSVNAGAYAYVLKPFQIELIKSIITKITERQKLVKENGELTVKLKEWNEKLEDEVELRTAELRDSFKKLEILYKMRSQFVSIMSHELRTPTTALIGYAERLRENWKEIPTPTIQEYLNIIADESNRLVQLMSEIFEISKIQDGSLKLSFETIDIVEHMNELINNFRDKYRHCSFGFSKGSGPLMVNVDPIYLKSALSHILLNAVKYTPAGGNVLIFAEEKNEQCMIRVEDEGPGITKEMRDKVFDPFFRSLDDINQKVPGAGLGLSISKGIVETFNGKVDITDKVVGHSGCAVLITLPKAIKLDFKK